MRTPWILILGLLLLLCAACAPLQSALNPPKISITSLRLLPSSGLAPRFEIGLHVVNPNPIMLAPKGVSYRVRIEGHEIINGATSEFPRIAAYGEGDFSIHASTDLLNDLQLLSEMLARPRQMVAYELEVRLDSGSFLPPLRVRNSGQIRLLKSR